MTKEWKRKKGMTSSSGIQLKITNDGHDYSECLKKINDLLILIWWPVSGYRICYLQPNFISMRLKCWWIETIAFHGYFAIQRLGITSTSWSEQIGFSSLLVRVGLINLLIQWGLSIFYQVKKILGTIGLVTTIVPFWLVFILGEFF